jgi:hypothetical protein
MAEVKNYTFVKTLKHLDGGEHSNEYGVICIDAEQAGEYLNKEGVDYVPATREEYEAVMAGKRVVISTETQEVVIEDAA